MSYTILYYLYNVIKVTEGDKYCYFQAFLSSCLFILVSEILFYVQAGFLYVQINSVNIILCSRYIFLQCFYVIFWFFRRILCYFLVFSYKLCSDYDTHFTGSEHTQLAF